MKLTKLFFLLLIVCLLGLTNRIFSQSVNPDLDIARLTIFRIHDTCFYERIRKVTDSPAIGDTIRHEKISAAAPSNDNCGSATPLTVNAACINGTTENGTTQAGEALTPSCVASAFNQTVWYSFVATNVNMYVNINVTSFGGSGALWSPTAWASAVYRATGCPPAVGSLVSCKNSNSQGNGDGAIVNIIGSLIVGQTYYIQIGYRTGMGVNKVPNFCIRVGDRFTPQCNTCSNTCGAAYGFATPPTVGQVTAYPGYPQTPYIEGAQADTQCYTFTAINDTVDFNVIVNSTCAAGNVSNFTWSLYPTTTCGAAIQTGNLSNLRLTNLTVGASYTYCYSFTVPTDCYHTAYWPYFVGAATVPLPIELLYFTGTRNENKIELNWATSSEINSDYFIIERSTDAIHFEALSHLEAAHNSTSTLYYSATDILPFQDIVYYRLKEVDFDGTEETYGPISIRNGGKDKHFDIKYATIQSNGNLLLGFNDDKKSQMSISIYDALGHLTYQLEMISENGFNNFETTLPFLPSGIYFLRLNDKTTSLSKKIIKF